MSNLDHATQEQFEALQIDYQELQIQYQKLRIKHDKLRVEHRALQDDNQSLYTQTLGTVRDEKHENHADDIQEEKPAMETESPEERRQRLHKELQELIDYNDSLDSFALYDM